MLLDSYDFKKARKVTSGNKRGGEEKRSQNSQIIRTGWFQFELLYYGKIIVYNLLKN